MPLNPKKVMMKNLEKIALDRLGVIKAEPGAEVTKDVGALMLAEFAHVGVKIANPEAITDTLVDTFREVINTIRRTRGEKRSYAPLFEGFPEKLPDYDDASLRFIIAAGRLEGNLNPSDEELRDALDFTDMNWWPASSVPQDTNKAAYARAAQHALPGDSLKQWMKLRIVSAEQMDSELKGFMQDCFKANVSLREDVRKDLDQLIGHYGVEHIDVDAVPFRETRVLLFKLIWEKDPSRLKGTGASPDDLLRLMADLTDGDISLGQPIKYPKFNRKQRRAIINTLENSERIADIFKRRDLWLKIEKGLHLGEFNAPKTQEAFSRLRDQARDKTSLGSRFEATLSEDAGDAAELLEREAPGLLVRQLRRIIKLAEDEPERVIGALKKASDRVPVKLLLSARAQIADNGATYPRVAFKKSGQAISITQPKGHLALNVELRDRVLDALDQAISSVLAKSNDWSAEKVWIDPALGKVLLPDSLRATSDGLIQVERGTRLALGEGSVLRLFVHWKDGEYTTDLDLSVLALDENFKVVSRVDWTRLTNGEMVHSGDLTSAPSGAQEFIDIKLDAAERQKNWRYLVPSILRFSGSTFADLPEAQSGWMLRKDANSDRRTFDPGAVVNTFTLTGTQRTSLPFLVDLKTQEVLYVDVYINGGAGATVMRDSLNITNIIERVNERANIKTDVESIARRTAQARGAQLVTDKANATISFGVDDDCTFNALRPEKLLGEVLA